MQGLTSTDANNSVPLQVLFSNICDTMGESTSAEYHQRQNGIAFTGTVIHNLWYCGHLYGMFN